MAKTRNIQTNFLSGELSPLLKGSANLDQYFNGLDKASNVFIIPQGGVKRRAGLRYIDSLREIEGRHTTGTMTMPEGGGAADIVDDETSVDTTTTTDISTLTEYVVAAYDAGAAIDNVVLDISGLKLDLAGTPTITSAYFEFQYSDDASSWISSGVQIKPPSITQAFYYRQDLSSLGSHRYWRLVLIKDATDFTTSKVSIAVFNIFTSVPASENVKLIPFNVSSSVRFMLAATVGNIAAFRVDSSVTKIGDYRLDFLTDASVLELRSDTTENVCLLFQENLKPTRIIYDPQGSTPSFNDLVIDDAPFINIPQFDFNDELSPTPVSEQQTLTFNSFKVGQTFQIDVEGVLSKSITFAGDSNPSEQQTTERNIERNLQEMPVFGATGISVSRVGTAAYRITIAGESAKLFDLFSGFPTSDSSSSTITFSNKVDGSPRSEDIWSATRGYPRMGSFFGSRLWIGGTRDKKQTLMGSKVSDLLNFDIKQGNDDEGIITTLVSRSLTEITDIYSGRDLQIFTRGAEYAITESPITPATALLDSQSSHGSRYIPVVESDGAVIFADANNKTLREFVYSFNEDSYVATDISVLSSHLIKTPVSMDFLNGTSSEDSNWLFVINKDGTAAVLNKLRSQDINGFTSMSLAPTSEGNSKLLDVSVVESNAFFICQRTIAGEDIRSIELLDFNYFMDGSIKASSASTISGLNHLVGETVQIVADSGVVLPERVVESDGSITLSDTEVSNYTTIEAGINFVPTVIPMPLSTNIGSGSNVVRLKRIVRMNLRVFETTGLYVDGVPIAIRSFGSDTLDNAPEIYTGILEDLYPTEGWSRDIMPVFTCPDPTRMHLQLIDLEVESS